VKYIVSVDFGGSKIKTALIDLHGNTIKNITVPTHARKGKSYVLNTLYDAIRWTIEGFHKQDILGIGIGVASPVDFDKQVVIDPPNIPGWKNVKLSNIIQNQFKIKTIIENDVNCAALAESKFTDARNIVALAVGTGIGGGIIINNKIYRGEGFAGELGHIIIDTKGPKCGCGANGCLEALASGIAIKRLTKKAFGKEILAADLVKIKNVKAKKILKYISINLGIGLATIIRVLNPKEIILSGGVIDDTKQAILKPAVREMRKRVLIYDNTKIRTSQLADPVLLGAACLFLK